MSIDLSRPSVLLEDQFWGEVGSKRNHLENILIQRGFTKREAEVIVSVAVEDIARKAAYKNYNPSLTVEQWLLSYVNIAAKEHKRRNRATVAPVASAKSLERLVEIGAEPSYNPWSYTELRISVEQALKHLEPFERAVMIAAIQEKTLEETAQDTGKSKRQVEYALQNARVKMKKILLEDD